MLKFWLLPAVLVFTLSFTTESYSQSTRPTFGKKQVNSTSANSAAHTDFTLNSTLDEIIDDSTPFDPNTLWLMGSLKDITQPFWDPYDVDYSRNTRAVEKASTIQGGRQLSMLIKGSELKSSFDSLKRGMEDIKSIFNYSLQSDGSDTYLSKGKKGKKILELKMEFNLSQGLDPNLRLGENLRFRYDYVNQRPLLEYGVSF